MIHVPFDPDELSDPGRAWWETWTRRATRATNILLERVRRGDPVHFTDAIWADLREWLFRNVFHGKCAYCEGKVRPQSWGAAEHWRPKGGVSVRAGGIETEIARDGQIHPGYYWLAYDWRNVVPVCDPCNSGKAKGTQFPIEGEYAISPEEGMTTDELDERERPLLLHPFHDGERNPSRHIYFDEFGIPHPVADSKHGRASIDVFWLDRDDLNDDRRARFGELAKFVDDAIGVAAKGLGTIVEQVEEHVAPDKQYSQAGKDFIRFYFPSVLAELAEQKLP